MRRLTAEIVMAAVILLGSCFLYYETTLFPIITLSSDVGPGYWPRILLGGVILLAVMLCIQIYRIKDKLAAIKEDVLPYPNRFWYTLVIAAIYTFLMPYLGFAISTLLYCLVQMWLLGLRPIKMLGIVSLGITVLFLILFPVLLGVPMPRGVGVFRDISLLFY